MLSLSACVVAKQRQKRADSVGYGVSMPERLPLKPTGLEPLSTARPTEKYENKQLKQQI